MKIENLKVYNFENAFRGMRNPYNSWDKGDSYFGFDAYEVVKQVLIPGMIHPSGDEYWLLKNGVINEDGDIVEYALLGLDDMNLARKLIAGGPEHRKFLRQITVSFDLTAPMYWQY